MCNKVFSDSELEVAIAQLKTGKSLGCEYIFAEFILNMGEKARSSLLRIFNIVWREASAVLPFGER